MFLFTITRDKIENINPLSRLYDLQTLNLSSNPMTEIGALERLSKLVRLNLSKTLIRTIPSGLSRLEKGARLNAERRLSPPKRFKLLEKTSKKSRKKPPIWVQNLIPLTLSRI